MIHIHEFKRSSPLYQIPEKYHSFLRGWFSRFGDRYYVFYHNDRFNYGKTDKFTPVFGRFSSGDLDIYAIYDDPTQGYDYVFDEKHLDHLIIIP